jgi:NitT/TauT family transport system ATP-binding protein
LTDRALPKISIRNLRKEFLSRDKRGRPTKSFTALDGITLNIAEGEFLSIVGPSGCGKSTLLDILAGLSPVTSGEVLQDGQAINGASLDRGVVFQQYALFPWLTALENVAFSLAGKRLPDEEKRAIAKQNLALVGLNGFDDRYPHQLSGGMKQRVALARSLAHDPSILLMDEPFAALDAQMRELLQGELLRLWRQTRKTVVFITHAIDEAIYLGQKVAVMTSSPGRIKRIIDNPLVGRPVDEDLRGTPEFSRLRHEVWSLLRDEVDQVAASEFAAAS